MGFFDDFTEEDFKTSANLGALAISSSDLESDEAERETDAMFDTGLSTQEQETDAMFETESVPLATYQTGGTLEDYSPAPPLEKPGVLDRPPSDFSMPGAETTVPPLAIDNDFLVQVEGFETDGYVPQQDGQAMGKSGVTIASGLDLGQHDQKSLRSMGIPEGTISKLTPYLGVKQQNAIDLLATRPLELEEEEALEINRLVKGHYAKAVAKRFNKDSDMDFQDLPSGMQTALVSVNFQYGNAAYGHDFWNQMTSGNFMDAIQNLRTWGSYQGRRDQEAQLIIDSLRG